MTISRIEEHVVPGKRLGRHVDSRLREAARPYAGPRKAVASVTWERNIPILDQGDTGSCTGNAMTGALGTGFLYAALPAGITLDEGEALKLYSAAESIDGDGPYPPNDNGSTGPSVARAAEDGGLISGFTHYTDLDSALQALMDGPVILGVNWYSSFDTPAADGTVSIAADAFVRGGHEVVARIIDATAQVIGLDNSWGPSWGVDGSFRMSFATLERLLAENGDCTAPEPLKAPAPPAPTPPAPVPPSPQPPEPDHKSLLAELAALVRACPRLSGESPQTRRGTSPSSLSSSSPTVSRPLGGHVSKFVSLVKTEPALFTGAVQAILALIAGLVPITAAESGAALAFTTAVLTLIAAIATRPFQVSALTGVVTVAATLLVAFGLKNVSPALVAEVNGVIVAAFAFFGIRPQVTPVATLRAKAAAARM